MFEPTSSERRIDRQFSTPAENKAEELGSGNWKSALHLDVDKTYPYYAVANAKEDLKGKNLKDLLASTQQDEDIWKPATMVNDKKFLMSSQGEYTITQDPEQNIPVELVRAAAKIKLNISSTVKDYHIKEVKWKFINYNTNTAIFAGQPVTPNIIKDNQENKATAEKDEKGNDIYKVTTYSYSTTWNGKDDMPQFVADVTFEKIRMQIQPLPSIWLSLCVIRKAKRSWSATISIPSMQSLSIWIPRQILITTERQTI